ncbi:unnamed protein product [Diatraea saccharalis]|uniref:Uncharacterized protein n=1 Tax=Diatraea saccharalis TaxID=40085 RepID=A0A9N9RBS6_9NEOP|nr:unnamed protein product [Diatraea saccharalis]
MHRILLLMAVLTRAIAPQILRVVHLGTEPSDLDSSTVPPPTVFKNTMKLPTRIVKGSRQGKVDSPMLNYIFDSYATSNKHFHDMFKPPSFEDDINSDETIVDADTGSTVMLDCRVTSLRDKTVS